MKYIVIYIIKLYQYTLSPDHSWLKARFPYGFCRFYPSCSQYAIEVVERKGVLKGLAAAGMRIIRCNPFMHPQVDPVRK